MSARSGCTRARASMSSRARPPTIVVNARYAWCVRSALQNNAAAREARVDLRVRRRLEAVARLTDQANRRSVHELPVAAVRELRAVERDGAVLRLVDIDGAADR